MDKEMRLYRVSKTAKRIIRQVQNIFAFGQCEKKNTNEMRHVGNLAKVLTVFLVCDG